MSKIEQLIQQYCPEGVDLVLLGEVCKLQDGFAFQRSEMNSSKEGHPIIRTSDLKDGTVSIDKSLYYNGDTIPSQFIIEKGSIVIGMSGSIKVARSFINTICYANQRVGIFKPSSSHILGDFLFYLLSSYNDILMSLCGNGTVKNLSKIALLQLSIPLPPLPVQEEIVKILDTFSELQAKLQTELQEELQARQQQYQYYRDKLLSFEGRDDVEWKKLGDISSIKTGRRFVRTDIRESGVPCFHYGDIYTFYGLTATKTKGYLDAELASKLRFAQPNDVVVVCAGENDWDLGVGVAWLGDEPAVVHDACCILHHSQNPRYISHFLRTHNYHLQMRRYVKNGKISSLPSSGLAEALIPIPSLEEQERIASTLDRFDALVNDLSQGLPAEIEARKQQYEYYRNSLLTFKRL